MRRVGSEGTIPKARADATKGKLKPLASSADKKRLVLAPLTPEPSPARKKAAAPPPVKKVPEPFAEEKKPGSALLMQAQDGEEQDTAVPDEQTSAEAMRKEEVELMAAVTDGDVRRVQEVFQRCPTVLSIDSCGGITSTALLYAARGGHEEVCTVLLQNKCDPQAADFKGRTALHYGQDFPSIVEMVQSHMARSPPGGWQKDDNGQEGFVNPDRWK